MRRRHCSLPPQDDRGSPCLAGATTCSPRAGFQFVSSVVATVTWENRMVAASGFWDGWLYGWGDGLVFVRSPESERRGRGGRRRRGNGKLPRGGGGRPTIDARWLNGIKSKDTRSQEDKSTGIERRFRQNSIWISHCRPFRVLRVLRVFCVRFSWTAKMHILPVSHDAARTRRADAGHLLAMPATNRMRKHRCATSR